MPKVRLALISDNFQFEKSGEYSIIGIFERRFAPGFPAKGDQFYVIVFWEGLVGEMFDLSIAIVNRDGQILSAKPPLRVEMEQPKHMTITKFVDVVFDIAGNYTINIYADSVLIEQVPFIIEQLNLHDKGL